MYLGTAISLANQNDYLASSLRAKVVSALSVVCKIIGRSPGGRTELRNQSKSIYMTKSRANQKAKPPFFENVPHEPATEKEWHAPPKSEK